MTLRTLGTARGVIITYTIAWKVSVEVTLENLYRWPRTAPRGTCGCVNSKQRVSYGESAE